MAVPQYALPLCTMLGELVTWYGFAEKSQNNWSLRRNGHSRSLHYGNQLLAVTVYYDVNRNMGSLTV